MPRSSAVVQTDKASRYLVQLCKHFSHKVHAEWTETDAYVDFKFGTCQITATSQAISFQATAPDSTGHGRVQYVVTDHLERFGARQGLKVTWTPVADDAATE